MDTETVIALVLGSLALIISVIVGLIAIILPVYYYQKLSSEISSSGSTGSTGNTGSTNNNSNGFFTYKTIASFVTTNSITPVNNDRIYYTTTNQTTLTDNIYNHQGYAPSTSMITLNYWSQSPTTNLRASYVFANRCYQNISNPLSYFTISLSNSYTINGNYSGANSYINIPIGYLVLVDIYQENVNLQMIRDTYLASGLDSDGTNKAYYLTPYVYINSYNQPGDSSTAIDIVPNTKIFTISQAPGDTSNSKNKLYGKITNGIPFYQNAEVSVYSDSCNNGFFSCTDSLTECSFDNIGAGGEFFGTLSDATSIGIFTGSRITDINT